jgi:hypothetical protein
MDRSAVRRASHQPIEHVKLADEVPLAYPANRWVARHLTNVPGPESQQADARAASRRGGRSLAAGMTAANDQNIVHGQPLSLILFHVKHRLFAEAETAEQCIQHILNPRPSGQPIERAACQAEILRNKQRICFSE